MACDASTQQLHRWQELRDALNKTDRQIYYSICPHGKPPATGPSEPWYDFTFFCRDGFMTLW